VLQVRKSQDRGYANRGWLESYHTFSFANYYDPNFMGFRALRVINEDYIAGGGGFATHPHQDMEIITYMLAGQLEHRDTLDNHSVIRPGEVQQMSAGRGVRHSEHNASAEERAHLLQIWIEPNQLGVAPRYGQRDYSQALAKGEVAGEMTLVASGSGRDNSIPIYQDAEVWATRCELGDLQTQLKLRASRFGWLQVAKGNLRVGEVALQAGDGLAISEQSEISLRAEGGAEFLFFDLP